MESELSICWGKKRFDLNTLEKKGQGKENKRFKCGI